MSRAILSIFAVLFVFSAAARGQTSPSATFTSGSDIKAQKTNIAFHIVDVGNAYVGVAIQHRPKAEAGKAGNPLVHSKVTEVYIVTEGIAKLATGGTMTDAKIFPKDNIDNGEGIGPGFSGTVVKPNEVRTIVAGDMIIIPKGTPHWFTEVPEELTYLVVRIDPEKSTVLK